MIVATDIAVLWTVVESVLPFVLCVCVVVIELVEGCHCFEFEFEFLF